MKEQKHCIMCKSTSLQTLWDVDKQIAQGCYPVSKEHKCYYMPFNITKCGNCRTHQLKYFGDPEIIYDYQANFYGTIRGSMNDLFSKFVATNSNIKSILEIGAGTGALANNILEYKSVPYVVADPTYSGKDEDQITVHKCFFENLENSHLTNINTLVMSHVFEHFFDPIQVLERAKNSPIEYIYLNFPDLESYIKEDNYHVLNPEHIYYVENDFIIKLFAYYGFQLKNRYDHEHHSVFFEFHRTANVTTNFPENKTSEEDVRGFFTRIEEKIRELSKMKEKEIYIWPASMHTIYLQGCGFSLDRIKAIVDNAPHKIGKYLYATGKEIVAFKDVPSSAMVIMNGGCYNKEMKRAI